MTTGSPTGLTEEDVREIAVEKDGGDQTLEGDLTIDTATPTITFSVGAVALADISLDDTAGTLTIDATGNELALSGTRVTATETLAGDGDDTVMTKGYTEDIFAPLLNPVFQSGIDIDPATGDPSVQMRRAGALEADVYSLADRLIVRHYDGVGGDVRMVLLETHAFFNAPVACSAPTNNNHSVTRQYAETNFVRLVSAQTIDGKKTFISNPEIQGTGFPGLTIEKTDTATGNMELKFNQQGANKAVIYYTPGNDRLNFRKQDGGSGDTDFQLHDTHASFNKEVRAPDPVAGSALTTKQYVENNFVDLTTAQTVAGIKTHVDDVRIDKSSGNPALAMYRSGDLATALFALSTNTLLRHYAPTDTEFRLYDNRAECNKTIRALDPVVGNDLTTRDWVISALPKRQFTVQVPGFTWELTDDPTKGETIDELGISAGKWNRNIDPAAIPDDARGFIAPITGFFTDWTIHYRHGRNNTTSGTFALWKQTRTADSTAVTNVKLGEVTFTDVSGSSENRITQLTGPVAVTAGDVIVPVLTAPVTGTKRKMDLDIHAMSINFEEA